MFSTITNYVLLPQCCLFFPYGFLNKTELINFVEWNFEENKLKTPHKKQPPNLLPLRKQLKLQKHCGSFNGTAHFSQCFCVEVHCIQKRSMYLVW